MLYIMRHGQTDWNIVHKLQGRTDIPLNDNGRQMAREAREGYQDMKIDCCYCSPLQRAKETAELFLEGRDIPIITDERLREMSFGAFEGEENVFDKPGHPMHTLFKHPEQYVACEESETFASLYARTGEFLREVLVPQLEAGKHILVVGHGAMNLSIINRVYDVEIANFWKRLPGNCELLELPVELVVEGIKR